MRERISITHGLLVVMALLLVLRAGSLAASAAAEVGLRVDWWSVDGGGGRSAGGALALSGTSGQGEAGVLAGGDFILQGGFGGGVPPRYAVFVPLALR